MLCFLIAQSSNGAPPTPVPDVYPHVLSPWTNLWYWLSGWQSWIYFAFLAWMVIYCIRNDPERYIWLWIMLLFQPFGAIIYFFARWVPSSQMQAPSCLHRWTKRNMIHRLEVAAAQIGNPHQYVQLGDALREVARSQAAAGAYASALKKEPDNLAALWGAANIDFQKADFGAARGKLEKVIQVDPSYKFGDVSLLYGKTLYHLNETASAREHLTSHIKKWRQPEGLFLLAKVCAEQHDYGEARQQLQALIIDVDSSPKAIARKFLFWKSRAKRLLRRLPKT